MSDPTRYRVAENQAQLTLGGNVLIVDPAGPLVEFSDYARLKYKSECQTEGINAFDNKLREAEGLIARMNDTINASQAECRRLKAEVERLKELNATLWKAFWFGFGFACFLFFLFILGIFIIFWKKTLP